MKKAFFTLGAITLLFSALSFAALDLRFTTDITITPDPANTGNVVTFSVNWKNFGAAVDNMNIQGGVDGATLLNYTYAHLDSGVPQETKTFTWTATGGSHTVWFELDPAHTCGDSNYANNRVEKTFTISGGSTDKPDLVPSVTITPAVLKEGTAMLLAITVKNTGNAASVPCNGILKEDGVQTESDTIPAISVGGKWTATVARTVKCNSKYEIIVDTANSNDESNEANNIWTKTMRCGPIITDPGTKFNATRVNGPDLTVKLFKWDENAKPQKDKDIQFAFNVLIYNHGNEVSVPCKLVIKKNGNVIVEANIDYVSPDGQPHDWRNFNFYAYIKCNDKLIAYIDADNKNEELNEKNNTSTMGFLCSK